jgi:hypothetical protein
MEELWADYIEEHEDVMHNCPEWSDDDVLSEILDRVSEGYYTAALAKYIRRLAIMGEWYKEVDIEKVTVNTGKRYEFKLDGKYWEWNENRLPQEPKNAMVKEDGVIEFE